MEVSASLNAIFLGGYVTEGNSLAEKMFSDSHIPVIARINADTNLYQFRVAYGAAAESKL
jgi:hypothetical protein